MSVKEFVSGFLVLGFAIFIAGFITGMLAVAFIPIKEDSTSVKLLLFVLGLIAGALMVALTLTSFRFSYHESSA